MSNFLANAQHTSKVRGLLIGFGLLAYSFLPVPAVSAPAGFWTGTTLALAGVAIQLLWAAALWFWRRRASNGGKVVGPELQLLLELLADGISVGLFAYSTLSALHQPLQSL